MLTQVVRNGRRAHLPLTYSAACRASSVLAPLGASVPAERLLLKARNECIKKAHGRAGQKAVEWDGGLLSRVLSRALEGRAKPCGGQRGGNAGAWTRAAAHPAGGRTCPEARAIGRSALRSGRVGSGLFTPPVTGFYYLEGAGVLRDFFF